MNVLLLCVLAFAAPRGKKRPPPAPPPVVVTAPTPVAEEPAPTEPAAILAKAKERYDSAFFTASVLLLEDLLKRPTSPELKIEATWLLAKDFLAVGNAQRARQSVEQLLELDPDFTAPVMTSPSVRDFFVQIKKVYRIVPTLAHEPPQGIDAQSGVTFTLSLKRMRPDYQARLRYRHSGAKTYDLTDLSRVGDVYQTTIPAALLLAPRGYTLEYHFVVNDEAGRPIAKLRDADAPFAVPVNVPLTAATAPPVYTRWWFWTIIGAAVVGGAVATSVVLLSPSATTGDANVTLRVAR